MNGTTFGDAVTYRAHHQWLKLFWPDLSGDSVTKSNPNFDHLFLAAGGFLAGAWWVKNQTEESRKSRAEKEDADRVEEICTVVGPILDDWEPEDCSSEDEFVEQLFN